MRTTSEARRVAGVRLRTLGGEGRGSFDAPFRGDRVGAQVVPRPTLVPPGARPSPVGGPLDEPAKGHGRRRLCQLCLVFGSQCVARAVVVDALDGNDSVAAGIDRERIDAGGRSFGWGGRLELLG